MVCITCCLPGFHGSSLKYIKNFLQAIQSTFRCLESILSDDIKFVSVQLYK